MFWAGVPVYFSGRAAVDLLGKSDRHIARLQVDRFFPGHSKWDWGCVLGERKPSGLFMTRRGLDDRPELSRDYVRVVVDGETRLFVRRDALSRVSNPRAVIEPVEPVSAAIRPPTAP